MLSARHTGAAIHSYLPKRCAGSPSLRAAQKAWQQAHISGKEG